ncbi:PTS sugar transporter subunit IIA [Mammaliicoccus sciuri]|uniref:PTS sugar transporter subunit IIA n=2 Tax=Mammaliicoccus sciuri TaxID=1296 RepID=UPI000D1E08B2|nr:PTS sugar transporter subunit IIA [Mammaliicoccus sciuri]PTJ82506.1 PTS sugar transporter subunit IIA [Mammaliicoccus sciuri]
MNITDLIDENTFIFDKNIKTKDELFTSLSESLYQNGYLKNKNKFLKDLYKREKLISTGIEDGFGIPHTKSKYIKKPLITFAKTSELQDYTALDNSKINIVFLIALPKNAQDYHLYLLSELAKLLMDSNFRENIKRVNNPDEILNILTL